MDTKEKSSKCSKKCNNGNCKEIDITDEAKLIFDCIKESNEQYELDIIVGILLGTHSKKLKDLDVKNFKTFGSLKKHKDKELNIYIKKLIEKEYIISDQNKILKLGNVEQLENENTKIIISMSEEESHLKRKIEFNDDNDKKKKKVEINQDMLTSKGKELFEKLRILRNEFAKKNNIAAFSVFTNSVLIDMCVELPMDDEKFLNIHGVGKEKLSKYGKEFIKEIKDFVENNPNVVTCETDGINKGDDKIKSENHTDNNDMDIDASNMSDGVNKEDDEKAKKRKVAQLDQDILTSKGKELFDKLKALRNELAKKNGIAAFSVFKNSVLIDMCVELPMDDEKFLNIHGVGKEKLSKYGKEFIKEIKDFVENNPDAVTSKKDGMSNEDDKIESEKHLSDREASNMSEGVTKEDDEKDKKKKVPQLDQDVLTSKGKELFEKLRILRNEFAKKNNMAAFSVFKNSVLVEMCVELPMDDEKFLNIHGVGKEKLSKYGKEFIKEIKDFVENNPDEVTYEKDKIGANKEEN